MKYLPCLAGIIIAVILSVSCESDNDKETFGCPEGSSGDRMITIPENDELDINNDSIKDFTVQYVIYTWDGAGISGDGISGEVVPSGENEILFHYNFGNLVYQPGDTIYADIEPPYSWYNYPAFIVSTYMTYGCPWPDEWKILSQGEYDFYYLAFKLYYNDSCLMGWMKLTADKESGEVKIIENNYIYGDSLVIEE